MMNSLQPVKRASDPLFPDLSTRADIDELMDISDCDTDYLLRTVKQFAVINRMVSAYRRLLNRYLLNDMTPGTTYHVVDLGAGGCDIPVWLIRAARRRNISLRVTAIDTDSRIVNWARKQHADVPELTLLNQDMFTINEMDDVDYIMANHVLHHLSEESIVQLLKMTTKVARHGFLFNDIHRRQSSYLAYSLIAKLLFHNSFAYIDGRRSIRKGFLQTELQALVEKARVSDRVTIGTAVPGRVYLTHQSFT